MEKQNGVFSTLRDRGEILSGISFLISMVYSQTFKKESRYGWIGKGYILQRLPFGAQTDVTVVFLMRQSIDTIQAFMY